MTRREKNANYVDALYPDDLTINHSGRLSDRQRRILYLRVAMWYGIACLDFSFSIFLVCFQIYYQFNIPGFFLWCIFLAAVAWLCIQYTMPFQKDIRNDEVKSIAGRVFKLLSVTGGGRSSGRIGYCTIRVGREVFTVSPYIYDSIKDDELYRLYYAPYSRVLLNFDHL